MTKQQTTKVGRNCLMIFLSAVAAVTMLLYTGALQVYAVSETLAVNGTVTVGDFYSDFPFRKCHRHRLLRRWRRNHPATAGRNPG